MCQVAARFKENNHGVVCFLAGKPQFAGTISVVRGPQGTH